MACVGRQSKKTITVVKSGNQGRNSSPTNQLLSLVSKRRAASPSTRSQPGSDKKLLSVATKTRTASPAEKNKTGADSDVEKKGQGSKTRRKSTTPSERRGVSPSLVGRGKPVKAIRDPSTPFVGRGKIHATNTTSLGRGKTLTSQMKSPTGRGRGVHKPQSRTSSPVVRGKLMKVTIISGTSSPAGRGQGGVSRHNSSSPAGRGQGGVSTPAGRGKQGVNRSGKVGSQNSSASPADRSHTDKERTTSTSPQGRGTRHQDSNSVGMHKRKPRVGSPAGRGRLGRGATTTGVLATVGRGQASKEATTTGVLATVGKGQTCKEATTTGVLATVGRGQAIKETTTPGALAAVDKGQSSKEATTPAALAAVDKGQSSKEAITTGVLATMGGEQVSKEVITPAVGIAVGRSQASKETTTPKPSSVGRGTLSKESTPSPRTCSPVGRGRGNKAGTAVPKVGPKDEVGRVENSIQRETVETSDTQTEQSATQTAVRTGAKAVNVEVKVPRMTMEDIHKGMSHSVKTRGSTKTQVHYSRSDSDIEYEMLDSNTLSTRTLSNVTDNIETPNEQVLSRTRGRQFTSKSDLRADIAHQIIADKIIASEKLNSQPEGARTPDRKNVFEQFLGYKCESESSKADDSNSDISSVSSQSLQSQANTRSTKAKTDGLLSDKLGVPTTRSHPAQADRTKLAVKGPRKSRGIVGIAPFCQCRADSQRMQLLVVVHSLLLDFSLSLVVTFSACDHFRFHPESVSYCICMINFLIC